jgi:hypothetical protein
LLTIAEAAHCARSTVAEALKTLEEAGIMSWVHRLKRVRVACPGLFGDETRLAPQRTSNGYWFVDPAYKSDFKSETANQAYFSTIEAASGGDRTPPAAAKEAFGRGKSQELGRVWR